MKKRDPKLVERTASRWIVTAVILAIYICVMATVRTSLNTWMMGRVFGADPMFMYLSGTVSGERQEIEGVDIMKLCAPEEVERNVQDNLETHREHLRLRIESTRQENERLKAELEGAA